MRPLLRSGCTTVEISVGYKYQSASSKTTQHPRSVGASCDTSYPKQIKFSNLSRHGAEASKNAYQAAYVEAGALTSTARLVNRDLESELIEYPKPVQLVLSSSQDDRRKSEPSLRVSNSSKVTKHNYSRSVCFRHDGKPLPPPPVDITAVHKLGHEPNQRNSTSQNEVDKLDMPLKTIASKQTSVSETFGSSAPVVSTGGLLG
jgi:hypothetical protein